MDREDSICFLLFEMRYHSSAATVIKALHRHYDESSHGGNNVSEREDQENGGPGRIKRASFSFSLTRQSSIYNLNDEQSNLASIYQVGACFHLDVFTRGVHPLMKTTGTTHSRLVWESSTYAYMKIVF
jgi:hypothetical protein